MEETLRCRARINIDATEYVGMHIMLDLINARSSRTHIGTFLPKLKRESVGIYTGWLLAVDVCVDRFVSSTRQGYLQESCFSSTGAGGGGGGSCCSNAFTQFIMLPYSRLSRKLSLWHTHPCIRRALLQGRSEVCKLRMFVIFK